jgi:glycosyltransferase involved in cell wall biosynthesis
MKIIIYNPNSRGGNYEYAIALAAAYNKHRLVTCEVLLPKNASIDSSKSIMRSLLSDTPPTKNSLLGKLYFLWRSFVNPIILFRFLKRHGQVIVILNDFDQVSSFFWAPLFSILKPYALFCVVLHDPDRDHYFRAQWLSKISMKLVMSCIDIAFYHQVLPDKTYYRNGNVKYVSVPHGLYTSEKISIDPEHHHRLTTFKGNSKLITALGNIRSEKNIPMIITTLKNIDGLKMFIGGAAANSSVDLQALHDLIRQLELNDRVLFVNKYLSDEEVRATGQLSDAFILYYADTFKSQSGVLNLVSQFKKPLLVSQTKSALTELVKTFKLGLIAMPDDPMALAAMLHEFRSGMTGSPDWEGYFSYASWENHVNIAMKTFEDQAKW